MPISMSPTEEPVQGQTESTAPAEAPELLRHSGKAGIRWDRLKAAADDVATIYEAAGDEDRARKIRECAGWLVMRRNPETGNMRVDRVNLCRQRHCPICAWRRAMKWGARFQQALPRIEQENPGGRWVFLTLTIRNCDVSALRETIGKLNQAFTRLQRQKSWKSVVLGWVKSIEVTQSEDGTAHPHIHALLHVRSGYFGKNYITADEWRSKWQAALKVDYVPQINIQAIKTSESNAFGEVVKSFNYSIKPEKLVLHPQFFLSLHEQMRGLREIATGGSIKTHMREEDEGEADTDFLEPDEMREAFPRFRYEWDAEERRYRRTTAEVWLAKHAAYHARQRICPECAENPGTMEDPPLDDYRKTPHRWSLINADALWEIREARREAQEIKRKADAIERQMRNIQIRTL